MSTTQHPLTETAAAEMWDEHHTPAHPILRWSLAHETEREATLALLRAAFDAGREHEREHAAQDRTAEITEEMVEAGASYAWEEANPGVLGWNSLTEHHKEGCRRDVRNVLSAALAVAAPAEPLARTLLGVPEDHGAPHHDASRIKADDYVAQMDDDGFIRAGRAHHQDKDGDWRTEDDWLVTWADRCADRPDAVTVWPAPTPPAEEVELPGEPRRLTDVVLSGGEKIAEAAWTGAVLLYARHPLATSLVVAPADQIEQWTLDGTRARRDGERPDGEPRFVKVQEEA